MNTKEITFNIFPFTIEMPIDDFQYMLDKALDHQDEFFILLIDKFNEIKEVENGKTAKS